MSTSWILAFILDKVQYPYQINPQILEEFYRLEMSEAQEKKPLKKRRNLREKSCWEKHCVIKNSYAQNEAAIPL